MSERIEAARRRLAHALRSGDDTAPFRQAIAQLEAAERAVTQHEAEAVAAAHAAQANTVATRAAELVAQVQQAANAAVNRSKETTP